jgi:hypothetical protein
MSGEILSARYDMPRVVGVHTIRADQVAPADEPTAGDRIDEHRSRRPGRGVEDVANLQHGVRHIRGWPRRADHQEPGRRRVALRQIKGIAGRSGQLRRIDTFAIAGAEEYHQGLNRAALPYGSRFTTSGMLSSPRFLLRHPFVVGCGQASEGGGQLQAHIAARGPQQHHDPCLIGPTSASSSKLASVISVPACSTHVGPAHRHMPKPSAELAL